MKFLLPLTILIASCSYLHASDLRDSLATDPASVDSIKLKVEQYLRQALADSAEKPAEAVENYRKALLTATNRDTSWEAAIRTKMGILLFRLNNKEAIAQLSKSDALYKQQQNLHGRAEVLPVLAVVYEKNSMFTAAIKTYNDLFNIQHERGEAVLAGNAAFYLCNFFMKKRDYQAAFDYADMAKNSYEKVCRKDSLGAIYLTIARIKNLQNKTRLAEFYVINRALPFFSAADDFEGRIDCFNFLGHLYQDSKRYSQAKWFYLQANTQSRSIKDTSAIITSLLDLTVVKTLIGELKPARKDLDEAELLSKEEDKYLKLTNEYKARYRTLFKKIDLSATAAMESATL